MSEVEKLRYDYEELRTEIDNLLLGDVKKTKLRIIGAFTGVGALFEKLLLYIIKKEDREKQLKELEGKLGLFEYKKILFDKIPKQQGIHIGTMNQWRNLVAHANDIDKIDEHELRAVSSALKSFAGWVFECYVDDKLVATPNDKLNVKFVTVEYGNEELQKVSIYTKTNTKYLPTKKVKKRIKIGRIVTITFIAGILICSIYYLFSDNIKTNNSLPKVAIKKQMNREEMYIFLENYFNSLNDKNSDTYQFFANKIDQFYTQKNINPTEVDIIQQTNTEYIDNMHAIDKESLFLYETINGINYWRFWNGYTCYRTSMRKFEDCKVQMEFGINSENKITSIKELSVLSLKYSKKKPK